MALGIRPTVDFAFKKIFGSPENSQALIGLLNAVLDLADPVAEVEILNPFSYQDFEQEKQIVLDVRARDSQGRLLNIEMQLSVVGGLLQRLTYYACSMFVGQLSSGGNYATLSPAISICLSTNTIFPDSGQAHHRFQQVDVTSGRELSSGIEVHTVELGKYNLLQESLISEASEIEQWAFFLLFADQYDADQLRSLLPTVAFQQAITTVETIAGKSEDRFMYDQREKAQRDYEWRMSGARDEARAEGLQQGREEGREEGLAKGMLVGKIQLVEQLLGVDESAAKELYNKTTSDLELMLAEFQAKLRDRDR